MRIKERFLRLTEKIEGALMIRVIRAGLNHMIPILTVAFNISFSKGIFLMKIHIFCYIFSILMLTNTGMNDIITMKQHVYLIFRL